MVSQGQDNARPHTARIAQDFLRHFQTLPWPARSPDLSPVEHLFLNEFILCGYTLSEATYFNLSLVTRKITRREDRRIVRQALVDPTVTRSTIRADVGVAIVPQTISRHLAETNLKSKRPFRALPVTPEHRQLRLQWCQARSMWNVTDLRKVVFSDESRFVLGTNDNRVRVWRHPGPFRNGLPGAIFQQDNARPHTARFAQDFLRHFQTLPWPARSPDLSPVEHVWDQLKRQMPSCHSVHDLELAVQDLWAHPPQNNIKCLINLIHRGSL
ncbi:transposable element Tcb2 transposase [Trichonephila clavipes]|nr:transposable element Tcb2 transposase [Trichonephila clavipes]